MPSPHDGDNVANRLTRVPDGQPPPLPSWAEWVALIADAFMWLMLSRPSTGSLKHTRITPATRWMSLTVSLGSCVIGVVLIVVGASQSFVPMVLLGILGLAGGAGSCAVGTVALLQLRDYAPNR